MVLLNSLIPTNALASIDLNQQSPGSIEWFKYNDKYIYVLGETIKSVTDPKRIHKVNKVI